MKAGSILAGAWTALAILSTMDWFRTAAQWLLIAVSLLAVIALLITIADGILPAKDRQP